MKGVNEMFYTIIFNENSYKYDKEDAEANYFFVKAELKYLMDVFECRKYLYMNQVFEFLGIKWNPKHENKVLLLEDYAKTDNPFSFKKTDDKNEIVIQIYIP